MTTLRAALAHADPLRDEPSLSTTDARVMRGAILAAADSPAPIFLAWALPVALLVAAMIVAGTAAGRRISAPAIPREADVADALPARVERRQVQFDTPGGTRIIWTIDPNFQVRGLP